MAYARSVLKTTIMTSDTVNSRPAKHQMLARTFGRAWSHVRRRVVFEERPSKSAMFRVLRDALAGTVKEGSTVVDAACQWAWHRALVFPRQIAYYGVDLSYSNLLRALRDHPTDQFIHLDILRLDEHISTCSVDCIVSTNTLEHLQRSDRADAIRVFHKLLKPNGTLFFTVVDLQEERHLIELSKELFREVVVHRYRSFASRCFEHCLSDEGGFYQIERRRGAGLALYTLARGLYVLERALSILPYPFNRSALVRCSQKTSKDELVTHELTFRNLTIDQERVWSPIPGMEEKRIE